MKKNSYITNLRFFFDFYTCYEKKLGSEVNAIGLMFLSKFEDCFLIFKKTPKTLDKSNANNVLFYF